MATTDWITANKSRQYPLSEFATAKDDAGNTMPEDLIIDARLFVVTDSSDAIYLSRYSSTEETVSVVFSQGGKVVGSATTEAVDLHEYRPVDVTTPSGDVVGFVLFGDFRKLQSYFFSSPDQSGITSHAVSLFDQELTKARFAREVSVPLAAEDIGFIGQGDIEVTEDVVVTEAGREQRRVSIGLRDTGSADLLLAYAGSANTDAESGLCGNPEPINRFGQVTPDCCNRIFIEFRGCIEMQRVEEACGVIIKCGALIDDLCPERTEPVPGELTASGIVRPRDESINEFLASETGDFIDPPDECEGQEYDAGTDQEQR